MPRNWEIWEIPERGGATGIAVFPYGVALQLKALGAVSSIHDELVLHQAAGEALAIYGGDSWFAPHNQTATRIAEYLRMKAEGGGH